jgi:hypothetical protein
MLHSSSRRSTPVTQSTVYLGQRNSRVWMASAGYERNIACVKPDSSTIVCALAFVSYSRRGSLSR